MIEAAAGTAAVVSADPVGVQRDSRVNRAMTSARDELAVISALLNDGHARLVELMRRVLDEGSWCGAGVKSPEHWLTAFAGISWSMAHDVVRIARRSTELPTMHRLLADGELTLGQAAVVAKHTPAAYDADVAQFASYATVTQLRRALCRYEFNADAPAPAAEVAYLPGQAADDEAAVDAATGAAQERAPGAFDPACAPARLEMRYTAGRFKLSYDAPADVGALVEQALLEAKDTLFRHHHDAATSPTFSAGPAMRRTGASFGEALALMAHRSLDTGAPLGHSRASRYRVYLHLDTTGHGWLTAKSALPPALRRRILCDGVIQPVWETDGKPVNVGRAQRIVPARTRRLLEDRDRGCRYPGCLAMHHLECHHLDHWADGGRTDTDRLIMLCPTHHDQHHRGAFVMVGDPTRPDGVTFTARDSTRIRPTFQPHTGPPKTVTRERISPPTPARYHGPTNDKLHLSLVHFKPRPPTAEPRGTPPETQDPPGPER